MSKRLKKRQEVNLTIDKVAFGGQGIGYIDDFVVFVENTLPGDIVTARIKKARKNYAEAYPVSLIVPSKLRQDTPCKHFGHCGGCKWQNIDYQQQLKFKHEHVAESLKHIGQIEPEIIHPTLPAPKIFGYRNKMEFSFSDNRWLTPEELIDKDIKKNFALGLHVPRHFDRVLDIEYCWLQSELANNILAFSKSFFKDSGVPVYNTHTREGQLRHLVFRQSFTQNKFLINVVTFSPQTELLKRYAAEATAKFPEISGIVNTINDKPAQVATGSQYNVIYGSDILVEKLEDYTFEISPDSFFQTNTLQAENLYKVARRYAQIDNDVIWDLYCGTGSIAIFVSGNAKKVVGFEIVDNAVQDAYRNAALNNVNNCTFVGGDLRHQLMEYAHEPPDVLICDPPRAGMHKDVVKTIRHIAPKRMVYVSCNPSTMARDLAGLIDLYRIVEVQPVDMFPHTFHIESVAKLVKR
jgi:23S rRNA (uracil1939-C5)-methyltransferase